jgi:hypothetical protein
MCRVYQHISNRYKLTALYSPSDKIQLRVYLDLESCDFPSNCQVHYDSWLPQNFQCVVHSGQLPRMSLHTIPPRRQLMLAFDFYSG